MTMISRVGFCDRCAKEQRPKTDQCFVVVGKNFHVLFADHIGHFGYTPHFYRLIKTIGNGDRVKYERLCGMEGCGTIVWWDQANQKYKFKMNDYLWEPGIMKLSDWNSLVLYKHDYDYEI